MRSELLSRDFWRYYGAASGSKRRLVATLWRLAAPTFVPAGFFQLMTVICQVAMPLQVRQLLAVLEANPGEKVIREGLPYAIGVFVTLLVNGICNHRHRHLAMKTGVLMRSAVVAVLYEQVLRLSPKGRMGLTSGEVANHVAVDTQKLFEVAQEGHLIWSLPLAIALVTIFLVLIMGPVSLVGIGVLIGFVPIVERITSRMLKIRQQRVKWTDRRVDIVNAMLQGIKVTKLNNYEENYERRVQEARDKEVEFLSKELAVWATTLFVTVLSPVVATAATFAVYVLVNENHILTAAMSFSVLLLFAALRFPINNAGRLIGRAAQAASAVKRITHFLQRATREAKFGDRLENVKDVGSSLDAPLTVRNASFTVGTDVRELFSSEFSTDVDGTFMVTDFDFTVKKGEVLAVCGPVGSGKSSLINGIIDELPKATPETMVSTHGSVAFVSQTPFILNTTLRENILFGLPYDKETYEKVLEACCLWTDVEQLGEAGDLTEIGERGVTLSGGQKQRVSLARAAYAQPDVVLLDDPLSALDAGTGKNVFEKLIKSPNAYFAKTAVVLVTHASHFLNRVDKVMVVVDGQNKFLGNFNELSSFDPKDPKTRAAVEFIRSSVQEGQTGEDDSLHDAIEERSDSVAKRTALMTIEEREHGISSLNTWLLWYKHAGGFYFMGVMAMLMIVDRFAYVALEYWLARWTQGATDPVTVFGLEFPPQTEGRSAQYRYLVVYALILLTSFLATLGRSEWSVTGGMRASRNVFKAMLSRVLHAPMSYFETTPMGRVLNRFTYDIEVVDIVLTQNMSMFLISTGWYFTGIIVMASILPYTLIAVVPVSVLYWILLLHYRKSGADLQRLDAVSRSPIQAMVTEGLDGTSTIRVFRKEESFLQKFQTIVDKNSSALLNFVSAQRWLGVRIELLGSLIVLVASVLVVCLNDVLLLEPGIVGLLIIWSSNFTITLGFLVDTFGEAEAAITAIERVDAMALLPQEKAMKTDDMHTVPSSWPEKGLLQFREVCLRYRKGLPLALNRLTFQVPAGKTCGVVGRTGAGKSSLTVALFRIVEIESGCISLDGVDLSNLGLSDVRGRPNGMAIIPQDPFLAGATLRECLDPFQLSSDKDIVEALSAVRLGSDKEGLAVLDTPVQEGGANFSVGERQLLNLARALLSKPRLLVLDEATASIDGETDAFIQKMLRTRFPNVTLLTIAHRLHSIMDNDLILVMDQGTAVELGSPADLLEKNGVFAELVNATGPEGAKALKAMVKSQP